MAFGLIFGIAYVATDDPHGYPVKLIKTQIDRYQSLTDSRARQPKSSPSEVKYPDFNFDRARHPKYKRSNIDLAAGKRGQRHRSQSIKGGDENFALANRTRLREVTAYNVGDPAQNYGDPCESANGEDICAA